MKKLKLRVIIDIDVDSEACKDAGIEELDVLNSLEVEPDDTIDGVLVFQKATDEIVLGKGKVVNREIVTFI